MASAYRTAVLSPFSLLFLNTGLAFGMGDALDKSHSVTSAFLFSSSRFSKYKLRLDSYHARPPRGRSTLARLTCPVWSAGAVCAGVIPFPPLLVSKQVWPASRVQMAEVYGDRPRPRRAHFRNQE